MCNKAEGPCFYIVSVDYNSIVTHQKNCWDNTATTKLLLRFVNTLFKVSPSSPAPRGLGCSPVSEWENQPQIHSRLGSFVRLVFYRAIAFFLIFFSLLCTQTPVPTSSGSEAVLPDLTRGTSNQVYWNKPKRFTVKRSYWHVISASVFSF